MLFTSIDKCRLCEGGDLRSVFDLGRIASCGVFPKKEEPDPPALPLELVQCTECSLVQLRHNFRRDDLFHYDYGYRSGINESMKKHLSALVGDVQRRVELRRGDVVLDIGSNDGTLLGAYRTPGLIRIGIDPIAKRFKEYYEPNIITASDFFTRSKFEKLLPGTQAKVITSIAMFYDLPDPNKFVHDITDILTPDGIWISEQSYLPTMVDRLSFDTICHEHLEYYGIEQLVRLVERNRLRIIDVSLNEVNGGSFQVVMCHRESAFRSNTKAIDDLRELELRGGYRGSAPIERLKSALPAVRARIFELLSEASRDGRLVHGYGASTKGNTLLQYFNIDKSLLPVIADRNPQKFGCRTPGTGIPIISEKESRKQRPTHYFVLPWHFRDSFIVREREFLESGGSLIFPLPRLEVVSLQHTST